MFSRMIYLFVLCLLFILLYFWCGKSAGQNLLANRPYCHSQFTLLYYIVFVLLLILFVISNVVIFSLRATTVIKFEYE